MSSTNSRKRFLSILGKILILAFVAVGVLQSGPSANLVDPYGFFFVLAGGVALVMMSFPGAEILRAFRHAVGASGNEAEIRLSAHFWEAAGRSFWILGGLYGILNLIITFMGMAYEETAGLQVVVGNLARSILAIFYGGLLAVIFFIPCWKLMGKLPSRLLSTDLEQSDTPASTGRPGWSFSMAIGYVLFLSILALTLSKFNLLTPSKLNLLMMWTTGRPAMLVVLGGTIALMLFMNGTKSGPTLSTAFAGMGFIGALLGCIQMLFGMTIKGPQGIGIVAGALAFVLISCFAALLGMAFVGAPLEDRAIRTGRVASPSAFSRVSWYVFPFLSLIFLVLVFSMIIMPLPTKP